MFVETITAEHDEWVRWTDSLGLLTDPPAALLATVAWDSGDGKVTSVNVWESPEAVADFFVERVHAVLQAGGEPGSKPERHGEPLAFYVRGTTTT